MSQSRTLVPTIAKCVLAFSVVLILPVAILSVVSSVSVASGPPSDEACRACHAGAAADFDKSTKSSYMSCTDCHSKEHSGPDTGPPGVVTPQTCAKCHVDAVDQFNSGKHYYGWEAMEAVPTYHDMPEAVTSKGCVPCHRIGYEWEDGSRGRCDLCHSRHVFSAAEASKPEACATCHAGEHPQYAMWANSKHGMIYAMEGDTGRAPTCVTCHGSHKVLTAWGFLGLRQGDEDDPEWFEARAKIIKTLETMGPAHAPEIMRSSRAEWQSARDEMIARCEMCHAESFVEREMLKSDALLREADLAKSKAIDIADMLYNDNLIDDKTRFGIFREATAHRFATYMGGFHNSANYAWDEGYLGLVSGIVAERDNAIRTKKLSIILTPSLAGLAVAVVSLFVGFWNRFTLSKRAKDKSLPDR